MNNKIRAAKSGLTATAITSVPVLGGYGAIKYGQYRNKENWDEMSDDEFMAYYNKAKSNYDRRGQEVNSTLQKYKEERFKGEDNKK